MQPLTDPEIPAGGDEPEKPVSCALCGDAGHQFVGNGVRPCTCESSEFYWRGAARMAGVPKIWRSMTLDRIVGRFPQQWDAIRAAQWSYNLACGPGTAITSGSYMHGPKGSGKSTIAAAFANSMIRSGKRVGWVNVPDFYLDCLRSQGEPGGVATMIDLALDRTQDLLVLDDLGAEKPSDFMQSLLYQILNRRMEKMQPLVATSNLEPKALAERIGERNASRLDGLCTVFPLFGDDQRKKRP